MNVNVTDPRKLEVWIPDGTYDGIWSGYEVRFACRLAKFKASTERGVRGSVPCTVTVAGEKITLTTK